jgi:signal-transduction protein with cAMP-binding, CBS, and nucleotidyltransferase domain
MVMGILVKNIMTKPAIQIQHDKTVQEAAKTMVKNRVGSIIVVKDNNPIGIITETDINKKIVAPGKDPKKVTAKEIMSAPIVFSGPNEDVFVTVEKMKKNKVKRIPVVENGKIIGIVADTDIARASPDMLDILNFRLKMREEEASLRENSTSGLCESCGEYSDDLTFVDDEWICENCRE